MKKVYHNGKRMTNRIKDRSLWFGLSSSGQMLEKEFVHKYADKLFWQNMVKDKGLDENFIEQHTRYLDIDHAWGDLFRYNDMSEAFIERHLDKIGETSWFYISGNKNLTIEFIEKYKNELDWSMLCKHQGLTEAVIEKFADLVDWTNVYICQDVSSWFLTKHKDKPNWKSVAPVWEINKRLGKTHRSLIRKNYPMQIAIYTTVGNEKYGPDKRGDKWIEAIESYLDLADRVIVVYDGMENLVHNVQDMNGIPGAVRDLSLYPELEELHAKNRQKIRLKHNSWPWDFSWEQIPKAMNIGLNTCARHSWAIRMDADYVLHEEDIPKIRKALEAMWDNTEIATFQKFSFVTHNRFYEKGGIPLAINKHLVGDDIMLGQPTNDRTDLCMPIRVTGWLDCGIPEGVYEPEKHRKTALPVYNYDYSFKTPEIVKEEFWRFSKAYHAYFDKWAFGSTPEAAFEVFKNMMYGRYSKCSYKIGDTHKGVKLTHPKYIQKVMDNLDPEMFCYNGWGKLK